MTLDLSTGAAPGASSLRAPMRVARPPRLALIGCGAIAGSFHLRALRERAGVLASLTLVDPDLDRARALAGNHRVGGVASSHTPLLSELDAAIIAAPHRFHYAIARECLDAGVHVLSEKPLAEASGEVRELARIAAQNGVHCAVNNTRRFVPAFARVRSLLREGVIGVPRRISMEEGDRYDWPVIGPVFGRASGGKGVLLDIGAHTLDLLCWWLDARPVLIDYRDDSAGGSEAAVSVTLAHAECVAQVRLSWLARQRNSYVIEGDEGRLEVGLYDFRTLHLTSRKGSRHAIAVDSQLRRLDDLPNAVYDDFLHAVATGDAPAVSARDVLPSISLIEECYERRRPFDMPWQDAWRRTGLA